MFSLFFSVFISMMPLIFTRKTAPVGAYAPVGLRANGAWAYIEYNMVDKYNTDTAKYTIIRMFRVSIRENSLMVE